MARPGRHQSERVLKRNTTKVKAVAPVSGDMRLRGGALPESMWRVGIQHPSERHGYEALTLLADGRSLRTPGFPAVVPA